MKLMGRSILSLAQPPPRHSSAAGQAPLMAVVETPLD
uniref:Uncharacterized protein n=1 Tax=Arundo donax TaxID=35708 RepID=A0A0A9GUA0_ARUDO